MAVIYRALGPGPHSLAGVIVEFDADALATCDDPEVLALVRQFPAVFQVMEDAPEAHDCETPAAPLEQLTVAELRALAVQAGIPRVSGLTKVELIAAVQATLRQAPE